MSDVDVGVSATGQDRATTMLRALNTELRTTTAQLREVNKASMGGDVDAMFTRIRDRRAQSAAAERRELVLTQRAEKEAAAEKVASLTATDRLSAGIKGASKVQETFNKVMGLAGFVGVIGGAIVGLVELANKLSSYGQAMARVKETQEEFNALVTELAKQNRDARLEKMTVAEREAALALERRIKGTDDLVKAEQLLWDREEALRINQEQQAKWKRNEALMSNGIAGGEILAQMQLRRLQDDENRLKTDIREKGADIRDYQRQTLEFARETTKEYQQQQQRFRDLAEDFDQRNRATNADLELGKRALEDAKQRAAQTIAEAKERGKAWAARVYQLGQQLDLAKAVDDRDKLAVERAHIEADARRGIISAREAELKLAIMQAEADAKRDERRRARDFAQLERNLARASGQRDPEDPNLQRLRDQIALQRETTDASRIELELMQQIAGIRREQADGTMTAERAALELTLARLSAEQKLADIRASELNSNLDVAQQSLTALGELDGNFSRLAGTLEGSKGVWQQFASGQKSVTSALFGTAAAYAKDAAAHETNVNKKAVKSGFYEQFAALASFAAQDYVGAGIHEAASLGFFAMAGRGKGGGGSKDAGGGSGGSAQAPTAGTSPNGGASNLGSGDKRDVVMVYFPNGIVYGMGSEVAKAGAQAATALDGTGMQRRRF